MILHLTASGQDVSEYLDQLKKELGERDIPYEIQEGGSQVGGGQLHGWEDTAVEILKIALTSGVVTVICNVIIGMKSDIELKLGENSLKISGYLNKKDKEVLVKKFLKRVNKLEKSDKPVYGSILIAK